MEHKRNEGYVIVSTSLLAATLYQINPDKNHKLWNIVSSERYILHNYAGAAGIEIISFVVKFRS